MKILFIGGTGVISSACSELCIHNGYELYLVNRRLTPAVFSDKVKILNGDIRKPEEIKELIKDKFFDVVVDWIAYTPEHILADYDLFKGKTAQYIFISTASAYQKPASHLPIKETEPLINPFWRYSELKIECENKLSELHNPHFFPVTVIRPSHTYDRTKIPIHGGYTFIHRLLKGKKVIIHGDGTSLWTLTHNKDFAQGFVGVLGNKKAIGETYHITSDEVLTWDQICNYLAGALGLEPNIVHIPSDFIYHFDKDWGEGLIGDKAHCMMFDNSKIKQLNPKFKAVIPFRDGAKEIVSWYLSNEKNKEVNYEKDRLMDEIITTYESSYKKWWEKK